VLFRSIWNLGTWYRGLPASSSHTLIGSIMGVGLANSLMSKGLVFGEGVNWAKASEVGVSLITSPIVGFACAAVLLLLSKTTIKRPDLFHAPAQGVPPPIWIRALLIMTCTGVSFAHGSNDGQKGMGLIMLILVGVLPGVYALNLATPQPAIAQIVTSAQRANQTLVEGGLSVSDPTLSESESELSDYLKTSGVATAKTFNALAEVNSTIAERLDGKSSLVALPHDTRHELRSDVYLAAETITKLNRQGLLARFKDRGSLLRYADELNGVTRFIPIWVKVCVAFTLGLGTMIGWKRIVVTVGEKIGKEHLSYAQGASAELVAMTTIGIADSFGLPVSTTHVLSSGVAGTMAANRSGLQIRTLRDIALAWLLTLPVSMFLGGALFAFALNMIVRLGMQ